MFTSPSDQVFDIVTRDERLEYYVYRSFAAKKIGEISVILSDCHKLYVLSIDISLIIYSKIKKSNSFIKKQRNILTGYIDVWYNPTVLIHIVQLTH